MEQGSVPDIKQIVAWIRLHRSKAVSNLAQYRFVHKVALQVAETSSRF
jgi:protein tyrosine phosphatase